MHKHELGGGTNITWHPKANMMRTRGNRGGHKQHLSQRTNAWCCITEDDYDNKQGLFDYAEVFYLTNLELCIKLNRSGLMNSTKFTKKS